MNTLFAVFLGGGLGSLARFGTSKFAATAFSSGFPLGTLISNVISCVILSLAVGAFSKEIGDHPFLKPLIMIGFCGGFSTFSTFSMETLELFKNGDSMIGIANIVVSICFCVAIIFFLSNSK